MAGPDPRQIQGGSLSLLDGPPPSPATAGLGQLAAGASTPANVPPTPDVLDGMMQTAASVANVLDTFGQMLPEFAPDFALVRDQLQSVLAKVVSAGGGKLASTRTGTPFPGSGPLTGPRPESMV